MKRRAVLSSVVAGAVGRPFAFLSAPVASPAASPSPAPYASGIGGAMQIVAHEDDDLLFMNPDIDRSIAAALPSTTIFVTAGEITGDGDTPQDRARNRQRGSLNAYAMMAGQPSSDPTSQEQWAGDLLTVNGKQIERYQLRDQPTVQVLFMNLRDHTLQDMDYGSEQDTVVPTGGLVAQPSHYSRADVVAVLTSLIQAYKPTVLRIQDAEPDTHSPAFVEDHPDHVSAARFAREAATGYTGTLYQLSYRDYNVSESPANLSSTDVDRKSAILNEYYEYDHEFQALRGGDDWVPRQYYRWSRGANWATTDAKGKPQLFVVQNGMVQWYSEASAQSWTGPKRLPSAGGELAPGLGIGKNTNGTLAVVAHRLTDHHLVAIEQSTPGGQFDAGWTDLGNPASAGALDQVGTPTVAAQANGRLIVFVPNATGGVSALTQSATRSWAGTTWTSLPGGAGVQDGLAALSTSDGRVNLFASTLDTVLHWRQTQTNGQFQQDTSFTAEQPASAPQAIVDASGRIQVLYLQPGTGDMCLTYQTKAGASTWTTTTVNTGDLGALAAPATALSLTVGTLLFAVDRNSGISQTSQTSSGPTFTQWNTLGGYALDQPTAVLDTKGQVVIAAIGSSGLEVGRFSATADSTSFSGWITVNS